MGKLVFIVVVIVLSGVGIIRFVSGDLRFCSVIGVRCGCCSSGVCCWCGSLCLCVCVCLGICGVSCVSRW